MSIFVAPQRTVSCIQHRTFEAKILNRGTTGSNHILSLPVARSFESRSSGGPPRLVRLRESLLVEYTTPKQDKFDLLIKISFVMSQAIHHISAIRSF